MSYPKYHGLFNRGSTCYLNSVLQVLFMTKEFREAVERYSCDSKSLDFHLKDLFKRLKRSTTSTYNLTDELGISRVFLQSDAAECFENILNKVTNPEASQLFQGILITQNECSKCSHKTSSKNPFWSLPLELEDCYHVENGIVNYFKESCLSGSNQLYCENCFTKSDTKIRVEMKTHPEVLTLLLKRFKFDNRRKEYVKISRSVKIPDILHIPPYGPMSPFYELYAYVEHIGNLRNGHYVVTIKAQDDGIWYIFNDDQVYEKYHQPFRSNDKEINQEAYLLFYRKISPTDSLAADDSGTSISGCSKSVDPCRIEGKEDEGAAARTTSNMVREQSHLNSRKKDRNMTGTDDQFRSTSDKPPEYRKQPKIDNNDNNMGMANKQVVSDGTKSAEAVDNKHDKQHQDLNWNQDSSGKLSESLPGGSADEYSEVSESKNEGINTGENQRGNNKMGKQKQHEEMGSPDSQSEPKRDVSSTMYDRMQQLGMDGFKENTPKSHQGFKNSNITKQTQTDDSSRAQEICSNDTTQNNRRDGDEKHPTSGIGQNHENLVKKPGSFGQKRTVTADVCNKPTDTNKPSQKQEMELSMKDVQYVQIIGITFENCGEIMSPDNEGFLILKRKRQPSGEDFSKQNQCHNLDCKIRKLMRHSHTYSPEEPCRTTIQSSLQGANADMQQSFGAEGNSSIDSLLPVMTNLSLNESSSTDGNQGHLSKSATGTENLPLTESHDEINANSHSDTQMQIETEEPDVDRKTGCAGLFKTIYNSTLK